jgi:hypothetical protein
VSDPGPDAPVPGHAFQGPTGAQSGSGNIQNNYFPEPTRPKTWMVVSLGIVGACLLAAVLVFALWPSHVPESRLVTPRLYWSSTGATQVGSHEFFSFSPHGYAKAKIVFSESDAETHGSQCTPDTRLTLFLGDARNNVQPRPYAVPPGNAPHEALVKLPVGAAKVWGEVVVSNELNPDDCPVHLGVPEVVLVKG